MSVRILSEQTAQVITGEQDAAANTPWIAIIELLIPILLEWLQGCGDDTGEAVKQHAGSIRPLERIALRMKVRRELGWRDYREAGGRRLAEALIHVAANEDERTIQAAIDEN